MTDQMNPYRWRATVLQDGHIDPITGPRCMVKPTEGPFIGRYLVAHTSRVLSEGDPVIFDEITSKAHEAKP